MSDVAIFVPKPRQLREIDSALTEARITRANACQEIGLLLSEVAELDDAIDSMLEVRADVARRLEGVSGA